MYRLPKTLNADIQNYESQIVEFEKGKLEPVKFKAIRVPLGIYEQRENGAFMVRVRCAGGFITPLQLKKVAQVAKEHHSNELHLTTRQEIQIQNLKLSDTSKVQEKLKESGLSSKGGGGNTVRNIMASIDSGIAKDEVFDVLPYVFDLTSFLIAQADSFTLPRKFKISFSNSSADFGIAAFNDLGFIAKNENGRKGFKVYIGGSLGSNPMVGYELFGFAPEEDLFYIASAAKELFSQHGNRKNKHKARLRHVFYKYGKEKVFELFFEIYRQLKQKQDLVYQALEIKQDQKRDFTFQTIEINTNQFANWKKRFVGEQAQANLATIHVPLINGTLSPDVAERFADFVAHFGDDVIRFSMRQNIHLRNIPIRFFGNVFQFLKVESLLSDLSPAISNVVSCTGADTCRLGICLSKGAAHALKEELTTLNTELDRIPNFRINISGCPNSCGQQFSADLGFSGRANRNTHLFPAYTIYAGAQIGENPSLANKMGEVSARDLPRFTAELLKIYLNTDTGNQTFREFIATEEKGKIAQLLKKYEEIPSFGDDKNYYFDWSAEDIFSLADRGIGECSAGLFDLIELDQKNIQLVRQQLKTSLDKRDLSLLLYQLLLASSRMLLITRGAEPRNEQEVFHFFIEKFIHSGLVHPSFKHLIKIASEFADHYDYTPKQTEIIEFSDAVLNLYEGMDDSLQFKNLENIQSTQQTEHTYQSSRSRKDLRGVACPMNFVKTKIELSTLRTGDYLEVLLDDDQPIQNVPGSVANEGHKIVEKVKKEEYWSVLIQKG